MNGYVLSSFSLMLYGGIWYLMREFSSTSASNSEPAMMTSNVSIFETMASVLALCSPWK